MAILIDVQPYCGSCLEFEPDVFKPIKAIYLDDEIVVSDTYVRCRYAKRCENMTKYFIRYNKNINKE